MDDLFHSSNRCAILSMQITEKVKKRGLRVQVQVTRPEQENCHKFLMFPVFKLKSLLDVSQLP